MQSLYLSYVLVSMWCVLIPPRMRNALKLKIRRDQRRNSVHAGYLRICLGGKVEREIWHVSDAY